MPGSLAYSKGVLYVGTEEKTAHVRSFDLGGRELDAGFSFRGPEDSAASAAGIALDEDHRIWVADSVGGRLCVFSLFGEEVAGVGGFESGAHDKGGLLGQVVDVVSFGSDDAQEVLVASAGSRRHALQLLALGSGQSLSLRSEGHVDKRFRDLRGIERSDAELGGEFIWACERGAGRVQVFRHLDFHFAFRLPVAGGRAFLPNALRALPDGRLVLAQGGEASALLLLDARGRLLRVLAESGEAEGQVNNPTDLALVPEHSDRQARLVAIDGEGTRVQVFNLEGDCYGTFPGFARSESSWSSD